MEMTWEDIVRFAKKTTRIKCLGCSMEGKLKDVFFPCPSDYGWHCKSGCGRQSECCDPTNDEF